MAAPERCSHSRSLFITDLGPMRFYVRPGPLKRQLSPLIAHGGGIMCRVQEPGAFLLAEPGQARGLQYISTAYINDCVRTNRRLSPRTYRLHGRRESPGNGTELGAPEEGEGPAESGAGPHTSSTGAPAASCEPGTSAGAPETLRDPRVNAGAPVLCDQSTNTGGFKEEECHISLGSNPAGKGATPNHHTASPGAPAASCEPRTSAGAPETSCIRRTSPRTPASCDQEPREAEGQLSLGSHPAGNRGTPSPHTASPGSPDASCDRQTTRGRASVVKDKPRAEQITESRGAEVQKSEGDSSVRPSTSGTRTPNPRGHSAEEDQARREEASEHQVVPGMRRVDRQIPCAGGRVLFSRQEDIALLRYVQENEGPTRPVTGNVLWKELEKKQLLRRSWQSMKCRYIKYILRHKHCYTLSPKRVVRAAGETPGSITNGHGGPSSADATIGLADPPPVETPRRSPRLRKDSPRAAHFMEKACADPSTDDSHSGGSPAIRRRKRASRRILYTSSDGEKGNSDSAAISKQLPQENQEDCSEDLQIFEIANMEFEVDDEDFSCNVKVPGISLKDFVMNEDSVSTNTQLQADDMTSSPGVSDCEGLQDALTDMMREFKLDICQITQALLKNNGEVGSTRHFLRTGLRPDGFPIWEHQDDVDLQSNDPRLGSQLARKYGADNVAKRMAFLAC